MSVDAVGHVMWQVLRSVDSPGTVITAVVLSHGGRMLFVGTSSGAVRSLRFPLATPGEWSEFRAHGSAIVKVTCPPNRSAHNEHVDCLEHKGDMSK